MYVELEVELVIIQVLKYPLGFNYTHKRILQTFFTVVSCRSASSSTPDGCEAVKSAQTQFYIYI